MRQAKILVVDDDRPFTRALSVRLGAAGYQVLIALDAESASTLALRERPDLILLDIDMPRYSGLEFHECLQFSERGRRIPVVYLSGNDDVSRRLQAQQQGACAFIAKPYESAELVAVLEKVLATTRRQAGAPADGGPDEAAESRLALAG